MNTGTRVKVHGAPYRGRTGVVVDPPHATSAASWPVWVRLDAQPGDTHLELTPKGFNDDELEPTRTPKENQP